LEIEEKTGKGQESKARSTERSERQNRGERSEKRERRKPESKNRIK
jgi:hypothetical protein